MKKFKLVLTLKNNAQRKKHQSIFADSIVEAIQKSEAYNFGYKVTEIEEVDYHILISRYNNTPINIYVKTEEEKEDLKVILRDYISKCDNEIIAVSFN